MGPYAIEEVVSSNAVKLQLLSLMRILYFIFYFYFYFILLSYFSIFRTARVRVRSDWLHCHIGHNLIVWSQHWL